MAVGLIGLLLLQRPSSTSSVVQTLSSLRSWLLQIMIIMPLIWYIWHGLVAFDCYPQYNSTSQARWFTGICGSISWFILSKWSSSSTSLISTPSVVTLSHGTSVPSNGYHHNGHHYESSKLSNVLRRVITSVILVSSFIIHGSLSSNDISSHITPFGVYVVDMTFVCMVAFLTIWLVMNIHC
jgi:hypothetical protein